MTTSARGATPRISDPCEIEHAIQEFAKSEPDHAAIDDPFGIRLELAAMKDRPKIDRSMRQITADILIADTTLDTKLLHTLPPSAL